MFRYDPESVRTGVSMPLGLQLMHARQHVNDAGDKCENAGHGDNKSEREKTQLQHHPRDRAHLANGSHFSGPTRSYPNFSI